MSGQHSFRAMPTAEELRQTGPLQQRWLGLPLSRIVLNPQNFVSDASEVEQNCDPTLPLGVGYYAFDQATAVPRFLSLWALPPGAAPSDRHAPSSACIAAAAWTALEETRVTHDGPVLTVATRGAAYTGAASAPVRLDDEHRVLRIAVRAVTGQWTLHLTDGEHEPVMLQAGSAIAGLHHLDLRGLAPAGMAPECRLILGIVGTDAEVVVDEMRLVPALPADPPGALEYETDWSPTGLGMRARYETLRMRGSDVFVDLDSVLRELELDAPLTPEQGLTLVGRHIAMPSHDPASGTLVMRAAAGCAAVALPVGTAVRYYVDESELLAGGDGAPSPVDRIGVWAVRLPPGQTVYRIGCGFAPDDAERAAALALEAARASAEACRRHWLQYWDALLAGVPHPSDFALRGVDPGSVTPAMVRASYYRAFVGLYTNVLPPQPETGFAFPTVATGKASMWNHGAPGARSAAAWETFLAIQFLAYADVDLAWSCFNGLMSLVDEAGSLAGESLPSRKAQTAGVLYALSRDRDALAIGYPALQRLLEWQVEHPRWVYGTYDNPGEQDAEFLSSLIIDLGFGARLAAALGRDEDSTRFDRLRSELSRDYRDHCFFGPEREAVQHWFPDDEEATLRGGRTGYGLQVVAGLAIRGLEDWQVASLLARFDAQFDASDQLAGFDFVKHPNVGHAVSGLIDHGRPEQAQALLNAVLRDVIRSGSFAEVYDRGVDAPRPWGVRPSIFGMTQVIDAVWLDNGLRMDAGAPRTVVLPGAAGGVQGIRLGDARYKVRIRGGSAELVEEDRDERSRG